MRRHCRVPFRVASVTWRRSAVDRRTADGPSGARVADEVPPGRPPSFPGGRRRRPTVNCVLVPPTSVFGLRAAASRLCCCVCCGCEGGPGSPCDVREECVQ
ncbi:hypothetical protein ISCGN_009650 [Ixodes scapularis]